MNNCTLCDEIRDERANLFFDTIGKRLCIRSRILFQDGNWLVIPAIGSFTPGYLLLVSKVHFLSIADFGDELFSSFEKLLNRIGIILDKQFGGYYVAFEHGSTTTEHRLSCCVDHMHLHIIPFDKDCWQGIVQKYNIEYSMIDSLNDIKTHVKKNNIKSYLFYQNINQQKYIIDSSSNIFPSQFFRQIISKEINSELESDWRHHYYEENILKTIELSRKYHWFD